MASVLTQRRYFYFSMPKPSKGQIVRCQNNRNIRADSSVHNTQQIIFHYLLSSMTTSSLVTVLPV